MLSLPSPGVLKSSVPTTDRIAQWISSTRVIHFTAGIDEQKLCGDKLI